VFGTNPEEPDPAQPMVDWISSAPPSELAAELMSAFGPEVPRRVPWWVPQAERLARRRARPVHESILEAIQLLEHAELVYIRLIATDNDRKWSATRLGLATLANGKAAVSQRIKDRTGLWYWF
jgi:hypothetical protein